MRPLGGEVRGGPGGTNAIPIIAIFRCFILLLLFT